jgi:hypothetical protein
VLAGLLFEKTALLGCKRDSCTRKTCGPLADSICDLGEKRSFWLKTSVAGEGHGRRQGWPRCRLFVAPTWPCFGFLTLTAVCRRSHRRLAVCGHHAVHSRRHQLHLTIEGDSSSVVLSNGDDSADGRIAASNVSCNL